MICNASNSRGVSRLVMASAITITLGMTAFAQDSPRLRTPRRAVEGKIDISHNNIAQASATDPNTAQGPGPGPRGAGPGCDVFPAPPSVGATVDLSYFGPSPSTVDRSLVGPVHCQTMAQLVWSRARSPFPLFWDK